jgi:mannose-6-phosphate isomerase-like protein (cupin superfamily)
MDIRTVFDSRHFSPAKMQKVNLFATTRFFCNLYCLESNQAHEPERPTDSDQMYLVLEGRGRVQVDSESAEIGPGQAVLAPAGTSHGVANATPDRLILMVFLAPP